MTKAARQDSVTGRSRCHDSYSGRRSIFPFEEIVALNETIHDHARTDVVTLTQLAQSGMKISRQVRLLGIMGDAIIKKAHDGREYIISRAGLA